MELRGRRLPLSAGARGGRRASGRAAARPQGPVQAGGRHAGGALPSRAACHGQRPGSGVGWQTPPWRGRRACAALPVARAAGRAGDGAAAARGGGGLAAAGAAEPPGCVAARSALRRSSLQMHGHPGSCRSARTVLWHVWAMQSWPAALFLHVHQKGVQRHAGVEFAEEDRVLSAYSYTPNDPNLPQQWAMYRLGLFTDTPLQRGADQGAWNRWNASPPGVCFLQSTLCSRGPHITVWRDVQTRRC